MIVGAVLAVALTVGTTTAIAPQSVERVYGDAKVAVQQATTGITGSTPEARLGATGDIEELDRCDGTFTQMSMYQQPDRPPVWAAHNNCGGDVLLPWQVGDKVHVMGAGHDAIYVVVEIRYTRKWAQLDLLNGLSGALALQTCLYGEDRMKFVALSPAPAR